MKKIFFLLVVLNTFALAGPIPQFPVNLSQISDPQEKKQWIETAEIFGLSQGEIHGKMAGIAVAVREGNPEALKLGREKARLVFEAEGLQAMDLELRNEIEKLAVQQVVRELKVRFPNWNFPPAQSFVASSDPTGKALQSDPEIGFIPFAVQNFVASFDDSVFSSVLQSSVQIAARNGSSAGLKAARELKSNALVDLLHKQLLPKISLRKTSFIVPASNSRQFFDPQSMVGSEFFRPSPQPTDANLRKVYLDSYKKSFLEAAAKNYEQQKQKAVEVLILAHQRSHLNELRSNPSPKQGVDEVVKNARVSSLADRILQKLDVELKAQIQARSKSILAAAEAEAKEQTMIAYQSAWQVRGAVDLAGELETKPYLTPVDFELQDENADGIFSPNEKIRTRILLANYGGLDFKGNLQWTLTLAENNRKSAPSGNIEIQIPAGSSLEIVDFFIFSGGSKTAGEPSVLEAKLEIDWETDFFWKSSAEKRKLVFPSQAIEKKLPLQVNLQTFPKLAAMQVAYPISVRVTNISLKPILITAFKIDSSNPQYPFLFQPDVSSLELAPNSSKIISGRLSLLDGPGIVDLRLSLAVLSQDVIVGAGTVWGLRSTRSLDFGGKSPVILALDSSDTAQLKKIDSSFADLGKLNILDAAVTSLKTIDVSRFNSRILVDAMDVKRSHLLIGDEGLGFIDSWARHGGTYFGLSLPPSRIKSPIEMNCNVFGLSSLIRVDLRGQSNERPGFWVAVGSEETLIRFISFATNSTKVAEVGLNPFFRFWEARIDEKLPLALQFSHSQGALDELGAMLNCALYSELGTELILDAERDGDMFSRLANHSKSRLYSFVRAYEKIPDNGSKIRLTSILYPVLRDLAEPSRTFLPNRKKMNFNSSYSVSREAGWKSILQPMEEVFSRYLPTAYRNYIQKLENR